MEHWWWKSSHQLPARKGWVELPRAIPSLRCLLRAQARHGHAHCTEHQIKWTYLCLRVEEAPPSLSPANVLLLRFVISMSPFQPGGRIMTLRTDDFTSVFSTSVTAYAQSTVIRFLSTSSLRCNKKVVHNDHPKMDDGKVMGFQWKCFLSWKYTLIFWTIFFLWYWLLR